MKYFIKLVCGVAVFLISSNGAFAASIEVDVITVNSTNTFEVEFSENPNLRVGELEAEIKVLKDISLRGNFVQDTNTVEIILEDPILPNTAYSLLTIVGSEGSIDFTTSSTLTGIIENTNIVEGQDITSIEISNSRSIFVSYAEELEEEIFEYKLLAENTIKKVENKDFHDAKIDITLTNSLDSEQDYILMFIELQDVDGKYIEFDTGIYDFVSPDMSKIGENVEIKDDSQNNTEPVEETEENKEEIQIDDSLLEVVHVNTTNEDDTDLKAAGNEVSLEKGINEVAGNALETPDTGAETWVLILASLFINTIYYLSRRKKIILA